MPRLFNFYVISAERLAADSSDSAIEQHGARWAQVEGRAFGVFDAFDTIDRLLDTPIIRGRIGTFSREETAALLDGLAGASREALARIEADPALDEVYWALRDTAQEATVRGACMVIACAG